MEKMKSIIAALPRSVGITQRRTLPPLRRIGQVPRARLGPRVGSGVKRIYLICSLAGCRKRRCQWISQFYLHTLRFICKRNEPSQPHLVLNYRPRRDGRLSRPWCEVAPVESRTCNLPITSPVLYHSATSDLVFCLLVVLLFCQYHCVTADHHINPHILFFCRYIHNV